jgi:hypothetical protein
MGIRTSSHIAKVFHAHNAKDDYRKVVLFPGIQEPPSHYGLLMIRRVMRSFALLTRRKAQRDVSSGRKLPALLVPSPGVTPQGMATMERVAFVRKAKRCPALRCMPFNP